MRRGHRAWGIVGFGLLVLILVSGCVPLLVSNALPSGVEALLARPTEQNGTTLQACVSTSTGAFRMINPGATATGTGMNRACGSGEQLRTWTAATNPPRLYLCVNTTTGAPRFVDETTTPTGTGKSRACSSGEQLLSWGTAGSPPRYYACVTTSTGAGRFVNGPGSPAGSGMDRACS